MKTITLHPVSVLAGLVLAGVLTVLGSAAQSVTRVQPFPRETVRLVGEVPAEWWTHVDLTGTSTTYTVPSDRYFVVTAVTGSVLANGQSTPELYYFSGNETRVAYPPGTLLTQLTSARLWGYLEPVQ